MATLTQEIPKEKINPECLYITRELVNLESCAAKDRHGITGVKITSGKESGVTCMYGKAHAWATEGHILVVRPLGYEYSGPDLTLKFTGPLPTKREWFEIPTSKGDHICTLKNGKKLVVTVEEAKDWPEISDIVNNSVESTKVYTVGMDSNLVKAIHKGLGTERVILRMSDKPLDPMIVQPADGDQDSLILDITTGGVNSEFSLLMPMRVD